jgi:capsular exopolysaccharide synthesis family protein
MESEELGLRHYVDVVWRRRWVAAGAMAVTLALTLAYVLVQPARYAATTTVLIEREEGLGRLLEASGEFFVDRSLRTQMELIKSRDVLGRAARALNPGEVGDLVMLNRRTQEVGAAVKVAQVGTTDLVAVVGRGEEPLVAQARANAVAEAYVEHVVEARVGAVNRALEVAAARLGRAGDDPGAARLYQQLVQVQRELELAQAAGQIVGVRIVDRALAPGEPEGPRLWLSLMLGALVGVTAGVMGAFGLEYMDRKIRSDLDVKRAVGLPVMGLIPHWEVQTNPHMVTLEKEPKSAFAEAFRVLRANLHFAGVAHPLRSMLVTSPGPGEGKTLIAANLARALVLDGQRVLLVDGDLRRPGLGPAFGIPPGPGLTSVLAGQQDLESCMVRLDGLDFLPSGPRPPNPAQLLGSQRMTELLKQAVDRYDTVIVDGPPVLGFADALVVGKQVDGTLLVARTEVTDRDALVEAKDALEGVGLSLMGVALNGVRPGYRGYRYRYYQKYYEAREIRGD